MAIESTDNIPDDLIIEILSRLPGKSLIKFRWVCKYWFDLIAKDHSFAKLQLVNHAINNPLLMLSSVTKKTGSLLVLRSFNCTEQQVDDEDDRTSSRSLLPRVTRLFKPHGKISHGTVVGSCNGLLCIKRDKMLYDVNRVTFCFWNPCTNEFIESSVEPILDFPEGTSAMEQLWAFSGCSLYGFGYDQTIGDYKLICNTTCSRIGYCGTVVQVYTLGTLSWKRIENYYPFHLCSMTKFIGNNGASSYCLGSKSIRGGLDVIVCFDIAKEEYREISKPWFVGSLNFVDLIELNGCLGLAQVNNSSQSRVVEVWMMKDYCQDNMNKNEYSWAKLYTIRFSKPSSTLRYGFKSFGIFNKTGDKILIQLSAEHDLYWYNEKDDKVRKSRSLEFCKNAKMVEAYLESLVSLNSGTYMCHHEEQEKDLQQEERNNQSMRTTKRRNRSIKRRKILKFANNHLGLA